MRIRDARAAARFELFLVTAVASVLVVRAALAATGYPQVGGGGLHVAHVLYGGLLMAIAIIVLEIVPGSRTHSRAAVVGGVGFGLFIDEVGKFLTKDVNYFFKPAVAVMYVVFVALYLGARELLLARPLTEPRRLALAATAVADLALGQLDGSGRRSALELLDGVAPSPLVAALQHAFTSGPAGTNAFEDWVTRRRDAAHALTARIAGGPGFRRAVVAALVLQILGMVAEFALMVVQPALGRAGGSAITDVTASVSTLLSAVYAVTGVTRCRRGDVDGALRVLYRSALVTLLLTQILVFARYQWSGLIGLASEGLLLVALRSIAHAHQPDGQS